MTLRDISNSAFEVVEADVETNYVLLVDGEPLTVPIPFIHHSDRLLKEIAAELMAKSTLDTEFLNLDDITYYTLFFINGRFLSRSVEEELYIDSALRMLPHEEPEKRKRMPLLFKFLDDSGIIHPAIERHTLRPKDPQSNWKHSVSQLTEQFGGHVININDDEATVAVPEYPDEFPRLVKVVSQIYEPFTQEQRAAVHNARSIHDSFLLAAFLLSGKFSSSEYAIAVLAAQGRYPAAPEQDANSGNTSFITRILGEYEQLFDPDSGEVRYRLDHARVASQARIMLDFIELCENGTQKLIHSGESKTLEFKSTLRWNLHTGKVDKNLEIATLKEIVAFLNTDGGILLIGVGDDGSITGIDRDGFKNNDGYLLHMTNLINEHIGEEYAQFLNFRFEAVSEKTILQVECAKCDEGAYLRQRNDTVDFYVRQGPSSVRLPTDKVVDWLRRSSHSTQ